MDDLIEPKRRNTCLYFEHFAIEDRSKMTQRCDAKKGSYFYSVPNYLAEEKSAVEVIRWHNGRSRSENYNKELTLEFSFHHVPCGDFNGNGVWFGLVILAYNLFIASKIFLFPASWRKKVIRAIRYEFIRLAGKIIVRLRQIVLRICSALRGMFDISVAARPRGWKLRKDLR